MPPLLRVASCFVIAGLLAIGTGLAQTITTTAGNGSPGFSGDNGSAISAQIDTVYGVAVDGQGNTYVADSRNQRVRKISNGIITTAAGNGQAGAGPEGEDRGRAGGPRLDRARRRRLGARFAVAVRSGDRARRRQGCGRRRAPDARPRRPRARGRSVRGADERRRRRRAQGIARAI